jgi:hypothetical protein
VSWAECDCKPCRCQVCERRPATLYVPVFDSRTREYKRHEHWCAPCRDEVFGNQEYAWCSEQGEWLPGQIKRLPIVQRLLREAAIGHVYRG